MQRETLSAIPQWEMEILREVGEGGEVTYKHPNSRSEVYVYKQDLVDVLNLILERFQTLTNMMDDKITAGFGMLLESLIRDAKRQLNEVFTIMDKTVGSIHCDVVGYNDSVYRPGRVLATYFEEVPKETPTDSGSQ